MRVLSRYTQVVKQSNGVSLETPTTEGGLSLADLSAKVIEHNHVVLNAQRVEQVKHCLGHHRRTSSERPCNKELAWLVGVAGVLPLPKNRQIFGSPVGMGTSAAQLP